MRATICLVLFAACAVGCAAQSSPAKRGRISGSVSLDGKPAPMANVRFIALEAGCVNVLAVVKNGVYDVPEGQGPMKGKYRVEFSVPSATAQRVVHPDKPGEWMEDRVESLPPRYHRDSTYMLDYDPDDPRPFNADLSSR
jgi:hypothetical protein